MIERVRWVEERIRAIRALLGTQERTNEEFGQVLARASTSAPTDAPRRDGAPRETTLGAQASRPHDGHTAPRGRLGALSPAVNDGGQQPLQSLIEEAAARTGLSDDLIGAVIDAESGGRSDAISPTGALGLMQLMPSTARGLGVTDPLDSRQNVLGGSEYLRRQLERFGNVESALAAYNAGPGTVERYGGVPPYPETESYVRRVLQRLRRSKDDQGGP